MKMLHYPFRTKDEFSDFLQSHNIVDESAVYDAENYDGFDTLNRIGKAYATAIADFLNSQMAENPRDVYAASGKFIVKNGHNFSQAWTSQSAKILTDELNRLANK